jgi:alkylhydroperoxidase family enzyme
MVILRVAWNTRCDYEFAQHAPLGERIGLTQDEIRNLGDAIDQGNWNENEANLLSFADSLIAEREVPDELWEAVSDTRDSDEMMELVLLVGYYRMLASFLKTMRVPLEDGATGLPE